jgi:hypothetical protein
VKTETDYVKRLAELVARNPRPESRTVTLPNGYKVIANTDPVYLPNGGVEFIIYDAEEKQTHFAGSYPSWEDFDRGVLLTRKQINNGFKP